VTSVGLSLFNYQDDAWSNKHKINFSICLLLHSIISGMYHIHYVGTLLVAQLVQALRCKPEGRGFDSRWCHLNFSETESLRPHYDPGVNSASNRNEYQEFLLGGKGGRCVGLTTLPSHVPIVMKSRSLNLLEPSRPVQVRNGIALPFYYTNYDIRNATWGEKKARVVLLRCPISLRSMVAKQPLPPKFRFHYRFCL